MEDQVIRAITKIFEPLGISPPKKLFPTLSSEQGQFAIMVNQIAKGKDPEKLAQSLIAPLEAHELFENVNIAISKNKKGASLVYLNLSLNSEFLRKQRKALASQVISEILQNNYGNYLDFHERTAVVEHTSANPISPLHIGNLRNSIHGDVFASILKHLGYDVKRIFYVNDVGLQIAFTSLGYQVLREHNIKPNEKIDLWLGQVYAIMNLFYSVHSLKKELLPSFTQRYELTTDETKQMKQKIQEQITPLKQEKVQLQKKLKEKGKKSSKELQVITKKLLNLQDKLKDINKYIEAQEDLKHRFPEMYSLLLEVFTKKEESIQELTQQRLNAYEHNTNETITFYFRDMADWCLEGFKRTLGNYRIFLDHFDYESEVTWSGRAKMIIQELSKKRQLSMDENGNYRYTYDPKLLKKMLKDTGRTINDIPIKGEIPALQLIRKDGTALYATKDIAYSILKFEKYHANEVYNVISTEQNLPQFQLLLPLYELGYKEYVKNLHHYAYELVSLKGRKMSGRLARYITADDFLKETMVRARMAKQQAEKQRRGAEKLDWKEKEAIINGIALASIKFALVETDPTKKVEIDVDEPIDLKQSTGPFVLYALARANGVLEKLEFDPQEYLQDDEVLTLLTQDDENKILELINSLHNELLQAKKEMNPSYIPRLAFNIATLFMKYYETHPILRAETEALKRARATMVFLVKKSLETILDILGIPSLRRM